MTYLSTEDSQHYCFPAPNNANCFRTDNTLTSLVFIVPQIERPQARLSLLTSRIGL